MSEMSERYKSKPWTAPDVGGCVAMDLLQRHAKGGLPAFLRHLLPPVGPRLRFHESHAPVAGDDTASLAAVSKKSVNIFSIKAVYSSMSQSKILLYCK